MLAGQLSGFHNRYCLGETGYLARDKDGEVVGKNTVRVDEAFIRRAVEAAEPNAVRMALYQATGDAKIAAMPLERTVIRGGAATQLVVTEAHRSTPMDQVVALLAGLGSTPIDEFVLS